MLKKMMNTKRNSMNKRKIGDMHVRIENDTVEIIKEQSNDEQYNYYHHSLTLIRVNLQKLNLAR